MPQPPIILSYRNEHKRHQKMDTTQQMYVSLHMTFLGGGLAYFFSESQHSLVFGGGGGGVLVLLCVWYTYTFHLGTGVQTCVMPK